MKEEIDWKKELLESGKFNNQFSKIYQKMEQRITCKKFIWDICITDGEKLES